VAATGIVMFFKASSPLGRTLHEWLGWLLVVGVGLHIVANWGGMKGHLGRTAGRVIIGLFTVVTIVSLVPTGSGSNPSDSTRGAVAALSRAPVRDLAPLAGRDAETLVSELRKAGYPNATVDSTCESLGGSNQGKRFQAMGVIFPASKAQKGPAR